jgi:transposase-like protein
MAQQFDVHPNQITDWKTQLMERSSVVFGDTTAKEKGPDILNPLDLARLHILQPPR